MEKQQKQYTQEFKQDAVNYRREHPELSLEACSKNLGVSHSALHRWLEARDKDGKVVMRGSGNYSEAASSPQWTGARLAMALNAITSSVVYHKIRNQRICRVRRPTTFFIGSLSTDS